MPSPSTEPRPPKELVAFEARDLAGLTSARAGDSQYNEWRLAARRKLAGLAHALVGRAKAQDLALDSRTSLHSPYVLNGMRVSRLWAYVTRAKKSKTKLRKVVGPDLAKDLDSAYRNLYLCVALEADALEVSLRIHSDAWFDGQNLVKRVAAEGLGGWLAELNRLDGFRLRLDDWKGEWWCGKLTPESLEEFLRHYTPGEHRLAVERRWPVPPEGGEAGAAQQIAREAIFGSETPHLLVEEMERLLPLYRYSAWSDESDFLFA